MGFGSRHLMARTVHTVKNHAGDSLVRPEPAASPSTPAIGSTFGPDSHHSRDPIRTIDFVN